MAYTYCSCIGIQVRLTYIIRVWLTFTSTTVLSGGKIGGQIEPSLVSQSKKEGRVFMNELLAENALA
jgi:hypothetical protein